MSANRMRGKEQTQNSGGRGIMFHVEQMLQRRMIKYQTATTTERHKQHWPILKHILLINPHTLLAKGLRPDEWRFVAWWFCLCSRVGEECHEK